MNRRELAGEEECSGNMLTDLILPQYSWQKKQPPQAVGRRAGYQAQLSSCPTCDFGQVPGLLGPQVLSGK